ncbi:MAG: hypothetical protein A2W80_12715 [Candidatus Riflebacteria bacterium GWC2_50_8]|nr:MAG: hypothetical protein A2W80_12715 [Candidatus Riflebacteria bacterium GWC2_50_8]
MKKVTVNFLKAARRFLPAQIRRIRSSRAVLKRVLIPALLILLFASLVFLPAYRFDNYEHRLTRFELAQMFESVLESCRVSAQPDVLPNYSDLNDEQIFAVYRTVSCNIIKGYPDLKFRPDEYLRNIETLGYLQKLVVFLRQVKPDSEVVRQLVRVMAYQDSPGEIMAGTMSSFMPEQFADLAGFTSKDVMADFMQDVIGQSSLNYLSGCIVNALTGEPLEQAYAASEGTAVAADEQGCFRIDFADQNCEEVVIMAAAEGFQTVELKKNIKFNPNIVLRLKPEKPTN